MKKLLMLLVLAGAMPLASMAQDDVYFTPSKEAKESQKLARPTYYSGSNRSIDDYNRHGRLNSWYQKVGVDSLGNDIIAFKGPGIKPDSSYVDTVHVYPGSASYDDDYVCTRNMAQWDDYYDPWLYNRYWRYGYYDPWFNPWAFSWYGAWYDPWYYDWYGSWYSPWYSSWYGWGWPYRYGWYDWGYRPWGGYYAYRGGAHSGGYTGTRTWTAGRDYGNRSGNGSWGGSTSRSRNNRSFGSRTTSRNSRTYDTSNRSFGNTRSSSGFSGRSTGGFSSSGGFGGGHSAGGGGSFGGGHSGGSHSGGSFGGRR